MTVEEAIVILDTVFPAERLSDIQELVFRGVWEGRSYQAIALQSGYNAEYIKHVGSQLWQLLSQAFGKKVTKSNVRSILRQHSQPLQSDTTVVDIGEASEAINSNDLPPPTLASDAKEVRSTGSPNK